MKLLNETNLVYFSTCSSQTTKEGWLYKKGEVNKNFQKRWFVLKGNLLFYFDKPGDSEPNGVIILEGYTVELVDTIIDGFTFQVAFNGASNARRYILQAESQHVMEQWMKAITCASYDYMRLMVAELKSQLDDLTAQELSNELADCKTHPAPSLSSTVEPPTGVHMPTSRVPGIQPPLLAGFETTIGEPSKARMNPFDRDVVKDVFDMDPFGQVPFNPTPSADVTTATRLQPPEIPGRKKNKNSPKIGRKNNSSPKISKKNPESVAQNDTKFYEDAQQYFRESQLPTKITSSFSELHSMYGEKIQTAVAASSNKANATNVETNTSDVLIQF